MNNKLNENVYNYKAQSIHGKEISLSDYKNKVVLIVNTASMCGFTPQFKGLQELYDLYHDKGFVVLGFPCDQFGKQEYSNTDKIISFCEINYGVTFPMFSKINVNGKSEHPLFTYLKKQTGGIGGGTIKWNFTKFLLDSQGNVYRRYSPTTKPGKLKKDIEHLLKEE